MASETENSIPDEEFHELADGYAVKMENFYAFINQIYYRHTQNLSEEVKADYQFSKEDRVINMLEELKLRAREYRDELERHPEIIRNYKNKYEGCPTIEDIVRVATFFFKNPEGTKETAEKNRQYLNEIRTGRNSLKQPLERL